MGPEAAPLAPRQEEVIIQTVTLAQTTFTTHVTLGSQPTAASSQPPPGATSNHQGNAGLSEAAIGAIAGSVAGVFLIAIFLVCCCRWRRPPYARHRGSADYSSSAYMDDFSPPRSPRPPRGAGPANGYGGPVPRPSSRTPRMSQTPMMPPPFFRATRTPRSARGTPRMPEPVFMAPFPQEPPEQVPGGPKYPTYKAIPIPNPRRNPGVPRVP